MSDTTSLRDAGMRTEPFRCGHPATPANTVRVSIGKGRKSNRCRVCERSRIRQKDATAAKRRELDAALRAEARAEATDHRRRGVDALMRQTPRPHDRTQEEK